jgi:hypothetical protein
MNIDQNIQTPNPIVTAPIIVKPRQLAKLPKGLAALPVTTLTAVATIAAP